LLREISLKVAKATSIQKERIETMLRDLEQFSASVRMTSLDVELPDVSEDPFEQAQRLISHLEQSEQKAAARAQAGATMAEYEGYLSDAAAKKATAEAGLRPLLEQCKVTDPGELTAAIERSNRKRDLERKREEQERAILESGDGLDLTALVAEVDSVDLTLQEVQLRELKEAFHALAEKKKSADLEHVDAQRALDAIKGQADAASAATRRNEALAGITDTVERYVRVRTMSILLKWAIERFRREKQGPLLSQASEVFATLTLGSFSRLQVEFDDRERPELLGVRPNGTLTALDAMSAGTTDQLYLALRVAALSLHLAQGKALPFIVDDLFIHFDDARSCAAFRVLGNLAQRTQVLFFTHHEHLIDVARMALGNSLQVIRLPS
jgi:uncharacterized protein YhaN